MVRVLGRFEVWGCSSPWWEEQVSPHLLQLYPAVVWQHVGLNRHKSLMVLPRSVLISGGLGAARERLQGRVAHGEHIGKDARVAPCMEVVAPGRSVNVP